MGVDNKSHEIVGTQFKNQPGQIRFSSGHYDWSAQLAHNSSTEDLDIHALSKAREVYLSRKPHLTHEVKHWTDTEFLQRLRLIKGGKLTYAALVLLGKAESLYKTGMSNIEIRWILQNTRGELLDYKHLYPPFLLAADTAYHLIRNTNYRHMTPESIFPEELQRYDEFTLREAINNAVAHVDYMANACIDVVEMENDKVIIKDVGICDTHEMYEPANFKRLKENMSCFAFAPTVLITFCTWPEKARRIEQYWKDLYQSMLDKKSPVYTFTGFNCSTSVWKSIEINSGNEKSPESLLDNDSMLSQLRNKCGLHKGEAAHMELAYSTFDN